MGGGGGLGGNGGKWGGGRGEIAENGGGGIGGNGEKWGETAENGGKWGKLGGNGGKWGEILGMAHGTWAVEGCGGMWFGILGQKCGKDEGKMGEKWDEIPIFYSPVVKDSSHTHRQTNRNSCHSPTPTATPASADACYAKPCPLFSTTRTPNGSWQTQTSTWPHLRAHEAGPRGTSGSRNSAFPLSCLCGIDRDHRHLCSRTMWRMGGGGDARAGE